MAGEAAVPHGETDLCGDISLLIEPAPQDPAPLLSDHMQLRVLYQHTVEGVGLGSGKAAP